MAEYYFATVYTPTKQHANFDAMSRYFVTVSVVLANK